MNTSLYEDTLKDFKEIFNLSDIQISYSDKTLSEPFEIEAPEGGCITFVHFLEHCQSWDLVKQWIEKQKHDIIIYMPCIEAAQNENWVHFHGNAVDHNVFMTAETLVNVGIKCGYKCKSLRYSDDMLVWMEKEK